MIPIFLRELETIFGWLLTASWQASVLALLVVVLQTVLRGRLNPRWRYALWLLVVVRLLLPVLPESALSLFQFAPTPPAPLVTAVTEPWQPLFTGKPYPSPSDPEPMVKPNYPFSYFTLLTFLWLGGAMSLLALTWEVNRRFARQATASPDVTDPDLLALFVTTKAELGISRSIRLIESGQVQSPAIMGLFQPTLLLPTDVREKFDARELRFIFLHELAHLKRGDVIVQALIALLQIAHWFNPVLWLAFRRMRIDREPATDAMVLSRAGEEEKERYGLMLIKLLEHFNQRHSLPTLVGILEDKDQFKRRFSLIARFTRGAYGWSVLGVLLIGILAVACLTKSKATETPDTSKAQAQTYLEVDYFETPSTSSLLGPEALLSNAEARKWLFAPANKVIAAKVVYVPLEMGTNTVTFKKPADVNWTVTLDWKPPLAGKAQELAVKGQWPHANGGDVSYGFAQSVSLRANQSFLVKGPWKTKESSNLVISLVDLPSDHSQKADEGTGAKTTNADAPPPTAKPPIVSAPTEAIVNSGPTGGAGKPVLNLKITLVEVNEKVYEQNARAMDDAVARGDAHFFDGMKDVLVAPAANLALMSNKDWYSAGTVKSYLASAKYEKVKGVPHSTLQAAALFCGVNADFALSSSAGDEISIDSKWSDTELVSMPDEKFDPKIFPADLPKTIDLSPKTHIAHHDDLAWKAQPGVTHSFWVGKTIGQFTQFTNRYEHLTNVAGDQVIKTNTPSRLAVFMTAQPAAPQADADAKPASTDTPQPRPPEHTQNESVKVSFKGVPKGQIEIGLKVLEIPDDVYLANRDEIEAAVDKADISLFNNLKGVSMLSTPSVTTEPGLRATIDIVREFPYPTTFENGKVVPNGSPAKTLISVPPTPREFETKDVGVSAEITPTIDNGNSPTHGKIILNGKLSVTNFEGFTQSNFVKQGMPSFSTSESYFIEALNDKELKGLWVPGEHVAEQNDAAHPGLGVTAASAPLVKKKYLLFVSASVVK